MNIVDITIALFAVSMLMRGAEVGLVRQALSLASLVIGLTVGSFIASALDSGVIVSLVIILLTLIAALGASEYAGILAKNKLHTHHINKVDRVFGAGLGVIICLAFAWFSSTLVSAIPAPELQKEVRDSKIIAYLDDKLPPVTDITKWFERSFAHTRLSDIIRELEPQLTNTDVPLPDIGEFSNVVASSKDSVVQIEGRSCQGIGVGSGFVVDENIIITNAHVVAGMLNPYVQDNNGRHSAEVIAFNPNLDVAILRVNNLAGKPLTMMDGTVSVGTKGVVLGYPGGEEFTATTSVVIERFIAIGPNIYNEGVKKRDVYALRSSVQEGNSGGPLIDASGTVIGVIFARSTAYDQVGYALTTPNVISILDEAKAAPSRGQSARCAP